MKLTEMNLNAYVAMLASDQPTPGGGSASALLGAQGAGLIAMVCSLTVGRKKYAEHEALCQEVMAQALQLKDRLLALIDRDTQVYQGFTKALALPRETDEEKQARKQAMQQALRDSALPPYDIMEEAAQGIRLLNRVKGKTNQNAASDSGVAAMNLMGALQGAWLNVLINLGGVEDQAFCEEYRSKGKALLEEVMPLAQEVYRLTEEALQQ